MAPFDSFRCSALLFDLDGVLLHSAASVQRSWRAWARERRLEPGLVEAAARGRRTVDTIRELAPELDAEKAAADLEDAQATDVDGLTPVDGAEALLLGLHTADWAVVTSGGRTLATARLRAAGLPTPGLLVAGDDVPRGKPDPSGYLLAAELIGQPPSACVVVEDSAAGVAAGKAAGMRVIGLSTDPHGDQLRAADALTRSCAGIRVTREGTPASLHVLVDLRNRLPSRN